MCWLSTRRFSSSTLTGSVRTLVAVGTSRLASMLAALRAATPRSGSASSSSVSTGPFTAGSTAGALFSNQRAHSGSTAAASARHWSNRVST